MKHFHFPILNYRVKRVPQFVLNLISLTLLMNILPEIRMQLITLQRGLKLRLALLKLKHLKLRGVILLRVVKIAKVVKIASQAIATKMLFESKFRMRRFSSDETDLKSKDLEKRQRYEALKKKDLKRRR